MGKRILEIFSFITLIWLLLIAPLGTVSASAEGNLQITNLAGTTVSYSYDQLLAMPMSNVSAALTCYGNLVTVGNWTGVSLGYLLQQSGIDPSVASIDFLAVDGYAVSIPLQVAMQSNVIIAYEMDGVPLSEMLRLVLPDENGNQWIAAITSINMSATVIDLNQYLAATQVIVNQLPPMSSIEQSMTKQQEIAQAQRTATPPPTATSKNETTTEPASIPANFSQPNQRAAPQQVSSSWDLGFPALVVYGIAFGTTVMLVSAIFLVHSRRRREIQS